MGQVNSRFARIRSLLTLDPATVDVADMSSGGSADALIVDLAEPPSGKAARSGETAHAGRRTKAAAFVTRMRARAYRPLLLIRIGLRDAAAVEDDLDVVMAARPDGLILAACPNGAAVQRLGAGLAVREAANDIADGTTMLVAEAGACAAGMVALSSFRGASPRLAALSWDANALSDDIGGAAAVFADDEGPRGVARIMLVLAARAAEVPAYDTAVAVQAEALARDCATARRLGFGGKIARDPGQVAVINMLFAPAGQTGRAQPM